MEREHDAPSPAPDSDALRGTRFEFGGRRPYSFAQPRVAERAAGRPLPGIGTVAIGHVSRLVPYGAFVDFLGFRGMIHISQLQPGQRVERVEDVVQLQDEVQVRVIGVDPERRHINLVLVNKLGTSASSATAEQRAAAAEVEAPAESAEEVAASAESAAPAAAPVPDAQASPVATTPPPPSAAPARRPAARPAAKQAARLDPKPATMPAVAQHGARAIRRELADPRHPMARLLASAGPSSARSAERERASLSEELPPLGRPSPVAPPPPPPVHVFGPAPEPEDEQPATLEALAARFGQRREAPTSKPAKAPSNAAERSRLEREKQAQILAKLREDAAKFSK